MLFAKEYLGRVGVGATSPHFFCANDRNIYIVKLQNNRYGTKVLISELLASQLGNLLNLCFPASQCFTIDESFLESYPQLRAEGVTAGIHFASQYISHATYIDKYTFSQITNLHELAGVIFFDHLFHNADRTNNRKNLLVVSQAANCKAYAIDNSHLFRSGKWTNESVTFLANKIYIYYRRAFRMLLKNYLTPQDFKPYVEAFKKISKPQIRKVIQKIPSEWWTNPEEAQTLETFIEERQRIADRLYYALCQYTAATPHRII
ncbi:HipA family kinase [Propionispora hippei]|uniref:HipA-like kinase domain-containing protein n=1 Tax=Propionispora hippei DSM 15287 TaxID=1123003 RepID=A0A1M6ATX0_9FIRM|nr:HipA family kinase [Propionispora hippei]SHI39902.1 hypothetical protein SAMN02745170_00288 [Propionispora hippei DSM 15287]